MPKQSLTQQADGLERLTFLQDYVVSRQQLSAIGYDNDAVRRRVATGRWQALGRAVVLHNGPIGVRERRWVAVLSAGPCVALAASTAAEIYGLRGYTSASVHVLVPAGARTPHIPRVIWHESRRFGRDDVVERSAPAIVTASRAIVDAASWAANARLACATLVASVQQRVTTVANLKIELGSAGQIEHIQVLSAVLGDIEGGADSLAEIDVVALARRAGLWAPVRQSFRLDADGKRRYLDVDFGTFSVEVDGGFHLQALKAWDDAMRQNALVIGGDRILRFPSVAIRTDPDSVIAQLRAAGLRFGRPTRHV